MTRQITLGVVVLNLIGRREMEFALAQAQFAGSEIMCIYHLWITFFPLFSHCTLGHSQKNLRITWHNFAYPRPPTYELSVVVFTFLHLQINFNSTYIHLVCFLYLGNDPPPPPPRDGSTCK